MLANYLAQDKLERFLQIIIWIGLGLILLTPLLVSDKFLRPFIYTKSVVFRIVVEAIFFVFLWLVFTSQRYRLRINLITIIFSLYLISSFVSSFFGINFYRSFWSNVERQEGLILLIHLWLLLIVLTGFLRQKKEWLLVLDYSIFVSLLVSFYSLGQYFGVDPLGYGDSSRLAATLGNASYLAGYLLFNILFAVYLLVIRRHQWVYWYYPLVIILELFILVQTGTRGAFIAFGLTVIGLLIFLISRGGAKLKKVSSAGLVLFIILVSLLFAFKDSAPVKKFSALRRVTAINLQEKTVQTRLMTWDIAWQGFKERPILGYGYENFNYVFNQYFDPAFYEDEGSRVWFDRAHNIIFDRLITGGIIGFVLFFSFLLYPIYKLFRAKADEEEEDNFGFLWAKVIFIAVIGAYIIQNLFVFDHLIILISLFLTLSYITFVAGDRLYGQEILDKIKYIKGIAVVTIIILIPLFYLANVKPTLANRNAIEALRFEPTPYNDKVIEYYDQALSYHTFADQEIRISYVEFIASRLSDNSNPAAWQAVVAKMLPELNKQLQEQPLNVANYLLAMRFNNIARHVDPTLLQNNFDLFDEAIKLSPRRTHIYYEIGYTQLYLGLRYKEANNITIANGFYNDAVNNFERALKLSPKVPEAHISYVMALINAGRIDEAKAHLELMNDQGIKYHEEMFILKMADTAIFFKEYELANRFYQELVELSPNNPQYFINLAVSYAYISENEKAIEAANKVRQFGPDFEQSADQFIKEINSGKFRAIASP